MDITTIILMNIVIAIVGIIVGKALNNNKLSSILTDLKNMEHRLVDDIHEIKVGMQRIVQQDYKIDHLENEIRDLRDATEKQWDSIGKLQTDFAACTCGKDVKSDRARK